MSRLATIRAFQGLPGAALARLEGAACAVEPRHGTEIFSAGDPADAVYAIVGGDGSVHIGVGDRRSKRLMVQVFRAGDLFGEIGVIDGGPRSAGAVVDGRVRLMRIGAAAFMEVMHQEPLLGVTLCRTLSERLRRTFTLFQDASFESLQVRLARQILYLAGQQGRNSGQGVLLAGRLRQQDLADLLGATTRSISTILNAWRAEGVVQHDADHARLTISRPDALLRLVDQDD